MDKLTLEPKGQRRITVQDLRQVKLERIKLERQRQNNQWTRALWQCRYLSNEELGQLHRYFFNCQAERACRIALERMKRVYEQHNRDLPRHYKFQVKLPYSKTIDLKQHFIENTWDWLKKERSLVGSYITITLRFCKNRSIEDLCTNHRRFAGSNCASTPSGFIMDFCKGNKTNDDDGGQLFSSYQKCTCNRLSKFDLPRFNGVPLDSHARKTHTWGRLYPEKLPPKLCGMQLSAKTALQPTGKTIRYNFGKALRRIGTQLNLDNHDEVLKSLCNNVEIKKKTTGRCQSMTITEQEVKTAVEELKKNSSNLTIGQKQGRIVLCLPNLLQIPTSTLIV